MRNAHIGLGVGTIVLIVGCLLFWNSGEDAMQMVGAAMLVAAFGTTSALDTRDERRRDRQKRGQ